MQDYQESLSGTSPSSQHASSYSDATLVEGEMPELADCGSAQAESACESAQVETECESKRAGSLLRRGSGSSGRSVAVEYQRGSVDGVW